MSIDPTKTLVFVNHMLKWLQARVVGRPLPGGEPRDRGRAAPAQLQPPPLRGQPTPRVRHPPSRGMVQVHTNHHENENNLTYPFKISLRQR